jgi:hypothetical protein
VGSSFLELDWARDESVERLMLHHFIGRKRTVPHAIIHVEFATYPFQLETLSIAPWRPQSRVNLLNGFMVVDFQRLQVFLGRLAS